MASQAGHIDRLARLIAELQVFDSALPPPSPDGEADRESRTRLATLSRSKATVSSFLAPPAVKEAEERARDLYFGPFFDAALSGGFPALQAAVAGASTTALPPGGPLASPPTPPSAAAGPSFSPSFSASSGPEWEKARIPWPSIEAIVEAGEKLGSGASGDVYRGRLSLPSADGKGQQVQAVAVKLFAQPQARFRAEVEICLRLRHPRVLALVGHGSNAGGDRRAIVTELLPNGTLEERLADLEWLDRVRIGNDLSEGVHYLHTFVQGPNGGFEPILHGDIKVRAAFEPLAHFWAHVGLAGCCLVCFLLQRHPDLIRLGPALTPLFWRLRRFSRSLQ